MDFFGEAGVQGGQFNNPGGAAVNANGAGGASAGDVYIVDRGNRRVQQFKADGTWVRAFGLNVGGAGIHVCEVKASCVQAAASAAAGGMNNPQGVAIDQATGILYVTDLSNRRIDVFSAAGVFQAAFGWNVKVTGAAPELQLCTAATGCKAGTGSAATEAKAGQFGTSIGFPAINPLNGHILIASRTNRRVDEFEATIAAGTITGVSFVRGYGWGALNGAAEFQVCTTTCNVPAPAGTGLGQFGTNSPLALAVDSTGRVYALDNANTRVQAFSSTPTPEGDFAAAKLSGEPAANDIVVDPANNQVLAIKGCTALACPEAALSSERRVLELDSAGTLLESHAANAGISAANGLALAPGGEIYMTTSSGLGAKPGAFILDFPLVPPGATIDPVTTFTGTTAKFEGKVTPDDFPATFHFEYSKDGATWTRLPANASLDETLLGDNAEHAVSKEATGLVAHTTYQVRLVASKAFAGGSATAQTSFETAAAPPSIVSSSHSHKRDVSVLFEGEILPQNETTEYEFEYVDQASFEADGFTSAESAPVPPGSISGGEVLAVEAEATGLTPNTPYRFRLSASNGAGTTVGPEGSFKTHSLAFHGLPDGRAYEQASPTDKGGIGLSGTYATVKAADDGSAVTFATTTGIPGGEGAQKLPIYLSSRGEDGWATQGLLPPASAGDDAQVQGWTEDFSHSFSWAAKLGSPTVTTFLSRSSDGGSLASIVDHTTELSGSAKRPTFAGATPDGSIAFFETRGQLVPGAVPGKPNLYAWSRASNELHLAGVLNDGAAPPGGSFAGPYDWVEGETAETLATGGASDDHYTQGLHAVTSEGSVFFTAGATGRLYLRQNPTEEQSALDLDGNCTEPDKACTIEVSASQKTNGNGPGGTDAAGHRPAAFMAATPDGSSVFFTSGEKLTDDATTGVEPAGGAAVARAELDGSNADLEFIPTSAAAVEVDGTYVYWVDPKTDAIGRAKLDGSEVKADFIDGADNPQGVAVDATHIYWTNAAEGKAGEGTIGRADVDGENVNQEFIAGTSDPQGIDVDATHVFWATAGAGFSGAIARAKLDGSEVNPEFISIGDTDVAVNATHVYFSFVSSDGAGIRRTPIDDGSKKEDVVLVLGAAKEPDLALDGSHLYWTDFGGSSIGRSNLDGTSPEYEFIKNAGNPQGIAVDASHIYWSANQTIVPNSGNDLYRYDADTGELTDLAVDGSAVNGARVKGVLGASDDGSRVYFVANGVLTNTPNARGESAEPGNCPVLLAGEGSFTCNLYLSDEGDVSFLARVGGGSFGDFRNLASTPTGLTPGYNPKTSFLTPDGGTLLFLSKRQLTDYDNDGLAQLYRYDAEAGSILCVSCNPTGAAPLASPELGSIRTPTETPPIPAPTLSRILSEDGNRVFFESRDALVATDVNGDEGCPGVGTGLQVIAGSYACLDVYMWEAKGTGSCQSDEQNGGCLHLLSTGDSEDPSFLADASASGDDVFLFTSEQLVGQDRDDLYDVYDARIGGGLPSQNEPPIVPCEGEGCKPGASAQPAVQTPGSSTFSGPGNPVTHKPRPRCPKGKRKVRRRGKVRCVSRRNQRRANQNRRASR